MFPAGAHTENVDSFMRDGFSVDSYLSKYVKTGAVEPLLDVLQEYLVTLNYIKYQLINQDCEQFIYLVLKLVEIDNRINIVKDSFGSVKRDCESVTNQLEQKVEEIESLLESRRVACQKRENVESLELIQVYLNKLNQLLDQNKADDGGSVSAIQLQGRAVGEINRCQFHMSNCKLMSDRHLMNYELITDAVIERLHGLFLTSVNNKSENLHACLHLYLSLNKVNDAHQIVRIKVVAPMTDRLLNENAFYNEPAELEGLYAKLIAFIDQQMKPLLRKVEPGSDTAIPQEFDFLVNSFWPQFENGISNNLRCIFALGNPDVFYKRYTETLKFLDQFEERCPDLQAIKNFRELPSYQNFMRSWNLSVYFQLRFQLIAGNLESVLLSQMLDEKQTTDDSEWKLQVTEVVWTALNSCWQEKVFLRQLSHRFWKLNMQILSRFSISIKDVVNAKCGMLPFKERIHFLVNLSIDTEYLLSKKIPDLMQRVCNVIDQVPLPVLDNMQKCMDESCNRIVDESDGIRKCIVDSMLRENASIVRQVNDIPRLFRRTNKENPTQPCPYVSSLLSNAINFKNQYGIHSVKWMPFILSAITSLYHEHVSEVLTSVQKTEESLRRFKKIRDPSSNENKVNSDDDKIRMQLQIDIQAYIKMVEQISESSNVGKLQDLLNVINLLKSK